MEKIRAMVREWKAEAARHGRPLKLPTSECVIVHAHDSAFHATQHLDLGLGPIWSCHGLHLFHHKSLAGEV